MHSSSSATRRLWRGTVGIYQRRFHSAVRAILWLCVLAVVVSCSGIFHSEIDLGPKTYVALSDRQYVLYHIAKNDTYGSIADWFGMNAVQRRDMRAMNTYPERSLPIGKALKVPITGSR